LNDPPSTRFTRGNEVHLGYQVAGDGANLVMVLGTVSSSTAWEEFPSAAFLQRVAGFCRLVTFDQRGSGRSDPVDQSELPTLQDRVDDVQSVMRAAGIERTALFGYHDGGPVAMTFAATYPERVSALVLANTWARLSATEGFPCGHPPDLLEAGLRLHTDAWGTGSSIDYIAPSVADNPAVRRTWARHEQATASPGQAAAISKMAIDLDVRPVLPVISVPTLILHASGDLVTPVDHGRYLADSIAGARLVEYPGRDHLVLTGEGDAVADEMEEFLTGVRRGRTAQRVLATVVFTDIVGSTALAASLGDRAWAELLGRHHTAIRKELTTYQGQEVDTAGDGFLAAFDGPGRAIECASAIHRAVQPLGIEVRIGVHTGECELLDGGYAGMAVHIGARVAAAAGAGETLVSRTVKDLVVGSPFGFAERGSRTLKGVPGEWSLYAVEDGSTTIAPSRR
jgi:pimeloyl-ACP methyl ester carboxylesterase